jgi:DNA-binding MarR family transcriptional regulator
MARENKSCRGEQRPTGLAFLLSQVGAHAANCFAEKLAKIDLSPPHAGILRKLAADEGLGQQALATHLRVMPSRIVVLIDELEGKGVVERRRSAEDRRNHHLFLTSKGRSVLADLSQIAAAHENELCRALDGKEKSQMAALCRKIAEQQGLSAGVHPGYKHLGNKSP